MKNTIKTTGKRTGLSRLVGTSAMKEVKGMCRIKKEKNIIKGHRLSQVRTNKEISGKRLSEVKIKNIAPGGKKLSSIRPIGKTISGKELTPFWKKVIIMTEK